MARTRRCATLAPGMGTGRLGDDPERLPARVIVHGAHDLGHQNLLAPTLTSPVGQAPGVRRATSGARPAGTPGELPALSPIAPPAQPGGATVVNAPGRPGGRQVGELVLRTGRAEVDSVHSDRPAPEGLARRPGTGYRDHLRYDLRI